MADLISREDPGGPAEAYSIVPPPRLWPSETSSSASGAEATGITCTEAAAVETVVVACKLRAFKLPRTFGCPVLFHKKKSMEL